VVDKSMKALVGGLLPEEETKIRQLAAAVKQSFIMVFKSHVETLKTFLLLINKMYYMKNSSEKKWCPCKETQPLEQKNFIYAPMDKPKIPVYAPVSIKFTEMRPRKRMLVPRSSQLVPRSSQLVAPDANVNIASPMTVERYTGFVPYNSKAVALKRERFTDPSGDSLPIDYGNALLPPAPPTDISSQQYDAAIAAFYSTLNLPIPENQYDYDAPQTPIAGPIPIEATAYASLPSEYAENFTPLQVNRYGTVSKWR
jgi:hypothetical protein